MTPSLRVLMLEDSPADAELMLRELRRAGLEVQWQRVDCEADFVAALATAPDVILADYSLPQFDGLRALEILKRQQLDIPFIFVSGCIGEDLAVQALGKGAVDYLLKDRLSRLGEAVRHAVEQAHLRRENHRTEQLLLQRLPDEEERLVLLEFLAGSRRLQIGAVDHAPHEPRPRRE